MTPIASAPFLRRVREFNGYRIGAADGDVGQVEDVYFDDAGWTIRYFVVDTGAWLAGRRVLISPASLRGVDAEARRLESALTQRQVRDAPSIDTAKPVSRQDETRTAEHYDYPFYWTGPYRWGPWLYPGLAGRSLDRTDEEMLARAREQADPHLHSAAAVRGYGLEATDGALGEVEDFLADEQCYAIRYLVVDPRRWWPGPHVIVSTEWIEDVRWEDSRVVVNVTREAVRRAPPYDASGALPREYEARLHSHHGRPGYWERGPEAWRLGSPHR
jgi:hypothetical protein